MANRQPIGVLDSGVGGISTLSAMRRELPAEHFIYYGDTANAPYGIKPREQVLSLVSRVVEQLMARQVKAIAIACNTATSVAAAELRAVSALPIIGIEPALKPAAEHRRGGAILVLATPVTLQLEKFANLMSRYGEGAIPVPCPGLMDLVEKEDFSAARRYLAELLAPYDPENVDGIVLGCTHYVFLRPLLREMLPERIRIYDGNAGTARQLRRVLTEQGLLTDETSGRLELCTSGDPALIIPRMEHLLALADTIG